MPTTYSSLKVTGATVLGATLAVVGAITGASLSAPSGSNTTITTPTGKDIVYQLAGTEIKRETSVACTATGGLAAYDLCYMPSPLTTTGAIADVHIDCGNMAKALPGDLTLVKAAHAASGTVLPNFNGIPMGTGSWARFGTGSVLLNPADKLSFKSLVTPTGALTSARYDCVMRATIIDIYGR